MRYAKELSPYPHTRVADSREALAGRTFWATFPRAEGTVIDEELRRVAAARQPAVFEAPQDYFFGIGMPLFGTMVPGPSRRSGPGRGDGAGLGGCFG